MAHSSAAAMRVLVAEDEPVTRRELEESLLALQGRLDHTMRELQSALGHAHGLHELIPVCVHCKTACADRNTWQRVEIDGPDRPEGALTHSLCTRCLDLFYPDDSEPDLTDHIELTGPWKQQTRS